MKGSGGQGKHPPLQIALLTLLHFFFSSRFRYSRIAWTTR